MSAITITFKGDNLKYSISETSTVGQLKDEIQKNFAVPASNQKLLHPSLKNAKDEQLLSNLKIKTGARVLLMGSTVEDIEKISSINAEDTKGKFEDEERKETSWEWETEEKHMKIIKKGLIDGAKLPVETDLPANKTITHLRNLFGGKMRMVLKYDHIAFHTDTGTTHLPYDEILDIAAQSMTDYVGYSIVRFKTKGESAPKELFVYFVPTCYTPFILMCNVGNILFG